MLIILIGAYTNIMMSLFAMPYLCNLYFIFEHCYSFLKKRNANNNNNVYYLNHTYILHT